MELPNSTVAKVTAEQSQVLLPKTLNEDTVSLLNSALAEEYAAHYFYRGEIQFTFHKTSHSSSTIYEIGDRIGQLVIIPYPQVTLIEETELSETERGEKGFGSSGK